MSKSPDKTRNRTLIGLLAAAAVLAGAIVVALWPAAQVKPLADSDNAGQVALGKPVYEKHCAACHGARLEGQPDWRQPLATGRMPAPPHDASGHTWHHSDAMLFGMVRHGMVPGRYAPPGHQSDMPAFGATLADAEIWAVLAYIKTHWPPEIRKAQLERSAKQAQR